MIGDEVESSRIEKYVSFTLIARKNGVQPPTLMKDGLKKPAHLGWRYG